MTAPQPTFDASPTRCPYCHESVSPDASRVCTDCLTRHHAECWLEHGRCSGCGSARFLQPGDAARSAAPASAAPAAPGHGPTIGVALAGLVGSIIMMAQPADRYRLFALVAICAVGTIVGWRCRRWPVPVAVTTALTLAGMTAFTLARVGPDPVVLGVNLVWGLVTGLGLGLPGAVAAGLSRSASHQLIEAAPPPPDEQRRPARPDRERA